MELHNQGAFEEAGINTRGDILTKYWTLTPSTVMFQQDRVITHINGERDENFQKSL